MERMPGAGNLSESGVELRSAHGHILRECLWTHPLESESRPRKFTAAVHDHGRGKAKRSRFDENGNILTGKNLTFCLTVRVLQMALSQFHISLRIISNHHDAFENLFYLLNHSDDSHNASELRFVGAIYGGHDSQGGQGKPWFNPASSAFDPLL